MSEYTEYDNAKAKIKTSIIAGITAEEDWDGPSINPGTLTDEQVDWLAAWLAGDGVAMSTHEESPLVFTEDEESLIGKLNDAGVDREHAVEWLTDILRERGVK